MCCGRFQRNRGYGSNLKCIWVLNKYGRSAMGVNKYKMNGKNCAKLPTSNTGEKWQSNWEQCHQQQLYHSLRFGVSAIMDVRGKNGKTTNMYWNENGIWVIWHKQCVIIVQIGS